MLEMWCTMTEFDFEEYGRVYVPINIKPQNDTILTPIEFKVDTGADHTTVAKSALKRIGYSMDWIKQNAVVFGDKDKPTIADGTKVNAGYIQLPLINMLGYEGKCWPFQIIVDEDKDFRNLLGRDLLTGFNYSFSNDDEKFIMERAKQFKPRFPFLPNQEINEIRGNT